MTESDFDEFVALLDDAYVFQEKKLSVPAKAVFFRAMSSYPLATVRAAMSAHLLDPKVGKWAMQPADLIAQIQGAIGNDGRPGADEAWAIALRSCDESDTVVWTQETAEAFAICQPVLAIGDEVGARVAFRDAYNRIVAAARGANRPVQWLASLGWDTRKREAVLTKAVTVGLLPAPAVAGLLPPPADTPPTDPNARAQLDAIRKLLDNMTAEKQRARELQVQREREETVAAKARQSELAANYKKEDAA